MQDNFFWKINFFFVRLIIFFCKIQIWMVELSMIQIQWGCGAVEGAHHCNLQVGGSSHVNNQNKKRKIQFQWGELDEDSSIIFNFGSYLMENESLNSCSIILVACMICYVDECPHFLLWNTWFKVLKLGFGGNSVTLNSDRVAP